MKYKILFFAVFFFLSSVVYVYAETKIAKLSILSTQYIPAAHRIDIMIKLLEMKKIDSYQIIMNDKFISNPKLQSLDADSTLKISFPFEDFKDQNYIQINIISEKTSYTSTLNFIKPWISSTDNTINLMKKPFVNKRIILGILIGIIIVTTYIIFRKKRTEIIPLIAFLLDEKGNQRYRFKGTITLGRSSENDIIIPDDNVSGFHAQIVEAKGSYIIKDLNSVNGIQVNNVSINHQRKLKQNDQITLGNHTFLFTKGE